MAHHDNTGCEEFEPSLTRLSVRYTQFDEDPEAQFSASPALQRLHAEERSLGEIPDWASEIVSRMLGSPLAPCGHYTFPLPVTQVIEAIGQQRCPAMVVGCYTADPVRKRRLQTVIYCLDAWLHGAQLETITWELGRRDIDGTDWGTIARRVYAALGDHTELRLLLVRRLIHRLRWWVKAHSWVDDPRTAFGLDQYLGDPRGDGDWGDFGDPELRDPYFTELREPGMADLEGRILQAMPEAEPLLVRIQSTWLCAPKTFRYIERVLHEIGAAGTGQAPAFDEPLLDSEDTYPDFDAARAWETDCLASLSRWLEGDTSALPQLGLTTPVKHWLAGLLRHRLELMARWTRFIGGRPSGRSGTSPLPTDVG